MHHRLSLFSVPVILLRSIRYEFRLVHTGAVWTIFCYWGCIVHPYRWFVMPLRFPLSVPAGGTFRTAAESPVLIQHKTVHSSKQRRVYRCKGTNKCAKHKRKTCFSLLFRTKVPSTGCQRYEIKLKTEEMRGFYLTTDWTDLTDEKGE